MSYCFAGLEERSLDKVTIPVIFFLAPFIKTYPRALVNGLPQDGRFGQPRGSARGLGL